MENVKLIIWDLDDTFWDGILSDGDVKPIPRNIKLVKKLAKKGIVSSICSKNDFNKAKNKLIELGVWDYFIFSSIDWTNKGPRIQNLIKNIQLRSCNCLFIDDSKNNLEEAKSLVGDLNIMTLQEFYKHVNDEALQGNDDPNCTRLKQYKILEKQTKSRLSAKSNEQFLYDSNIKVELITKCKDKLVRIHEMIHRNNQLNFTKDRISLDEVTQLFTDPSIKSGVVRVVDKFGDHGIVGCYAVDKNNIARQFVFSCRILGMGIEQWVYAELGYPKIDVVGDVASVLKENVKPKWIESISKSSISTRLDRKSTINKTKLVIYGTCPLRPIWSYLDSTIENIKFAEIDPIPSICNLAVAKKENSKIKEEWIEKYNLHKETFDLSPFDGTTDYLLITLFYELRMFKIQDSNGRYFFSSQKEMILHSKARAEYKVSNVTSEDIFEELSFICKEMCKKTKLIIMTSPNIEFSSKGKDKDYLSRLALNTIAHKIAKLYKNVYLLDINKYIKGEANFMDHTAEHYDRFIGFSLATDVLKLMGEHNYSIKSNYSNDLNTKNFKFKMLDFVIECNESYINGTYSLELNRLPKGASVQFVLYRNRRKEAISQAQEELKFNSNICKPGFWHYGLIIKYKGRSYTFSSRGFVIRFYNLHNFLDLNKENANKFLSSFDVFMTESNADINTTIRLSTQIATLSSYGINFADFFKDYHVNKLTIFTDKDLGAIVVPYLVSAGIKINHIYTTESLHRISYGLGEIVYHVDTFDKWPTFAKNENVLFICSRAKKDFYRVAYSNKGINQYYIDDILNKAMTRYMFSKLIKKTRFIAVRLPSLEMRHGAFNIDYYTSFEKAIRPSRQAAKPLDLTYISKIENLPKNVVEQLFTQPTFIYNNSKDIFELKDIKSKYVNVNNGYRLTVNNPKSSKRGTIYIFGNLLAYGYGNKDEDTIASRLQLLVGDDYIVKNYANCKSSAEYDNVVRLISTLKFEKKDILVFIQNNCLLPGTPMYLHWLNWDAYDKKVEKVDGFELFKEKNRPDYFTSQTSYSKTCNQKISELIYNQIYKK